MQSDELEDLAIRWIAGAPAGAVTEARAAQTRAEISRALAQPVATMPLHEVLRPGSAVTVVFDPADAACPNDILVPALIDELRAAQVADGRITLLMAHNYRDASAAKGGGDAPARAALPWLDKALQQRVVQHDPFDVQSVNQLGVFQRVPLSANFHAVESDFLIATGSVTPHRLAGLTGSAFSVGIGCAGEATINELFTASLDESMDGADATAPGNAFAQIAAEAGARAGLQFCVECSDVREPEFVARAGAPTRVHEVMIEILSQRALERGAATAGPAAFGARRAARSPWASVGARPWMRDPDAKPDPRDVIELTQ